MPLVDIPRRWPRWQGISLIAVTFVYFLIFAQFAFLKRLADLGITDAHLKAIMAAMAAGGAFLSLLAPRLTVWQSPGVRLRIALTACAAAAFLTLLPMGLAISIAVSLFIGSGLGLLTVTLVTHLRLWLGEGDPILGVGIGTGFGYFICNIPAFFTSSEQVQAVLAGGLCLAALLATFKETAGEPSPAEASGTSKSETGFLRVVICFTALVWLDSAAFFIIQNTAALKAGTWEGTLHLWANGLLHFAAALLSVWVLRRRGLSLVLSFAFLALAFACLLLLDPTRALLASIFYPVGVSLYSVALVAYPSLLAPAASAGERGRQAGWIYAVAGWFGSAMGIGMGQNLGHVPPVFVLAAGALVLSPGLLGILRRRRREFASTITIMLAAFCIERAITAIHPYPGLLSQIAQGRQVYISEGCINCHSQYVRPNTPDVLMWGPVQTLDELRREHPPLIGNRRQGPDLAEIGSRRSPLWLKAHFYSPSELSYASFMPSYAYLFRDDRGDALVAYLQSLQGADREQHLLSEGDWRPSSKAYAVANADEGMKLFRIYCSTCHAADGRTRQVWKASFRRLPPNLFVDPYRHVAKLDSATRRMDRLAWITKFGLPGSDMPGHESLSDRKIASISLWLMQCFVQTNSNQQISIPGERP
jgi:mono/diheme cytochrome c family protein